MMPVTQPDLWSAPPPAPPPVMTGAYWLGFEQTTADADARAEFLARYGVPPRELTRARGLLLAGPIPGR